MERNDAADVHSFVSTCELFSGVDDDALERLVAVLEPVSLRGGETLVEEGDPGHDVFIVVTGRLRVGVAGTSGHGWMVGEIGPGEIVGEMALLADSPRSATVKAIRDTRLLRLTRSAFLGFVAEHPDAMVAVAQLLVRRLERADHHRAAEMPVRTVALIPAAHTVDLDAFASALAAAWDPTTGCEVVNRRRIEDRFGSGRADLAASEATATEVTAWLHGIEREAALVVYIGEDGASAWARRCVRQADTILVVGDGRAGPELGTAERELLATADPVAHADVELVLVHSSRPVDTAGWLRLRRARRHHHVRDGSGDDMRRLVRWLSGRSIGLVLSGGGARGFAHFGVVRALREAGIPIDLVGGASFGATAAAFVAMDVGTEMMIAEARRGTVDVGSLLDFTFPYASLASGRRLTESMRGAFAGREIEDLWLDFFCVSSDLTVGRLAVHDGGELWAALRASVAIPGIFPPIRTDEGHVLVDGGIMDNMPVAPMRARLRTGSVIAVDLRSRSELPSEDLDGNGVLSGWRPLGRRLNPFRDDAAMPRMIDLLIRSTELASGERRDHGDLTFRPPLQAFGILEFAAYERIVAAGYRHAVEVLDATDVGALT